MEYELYCKIKKGNLKAFQTLCKEEFPGLWVMCYVITQDTAAAAALLTESLKASFDEILRAVSPPRENVRTFFSQSIFHSAMKETKADSDLENLPEPVVPTQYAPFLRGIAQLSYKERCIYALSLFGNLGVNAISGLIEQGRNETAKLLSELSSKAQETEEIKRMDFAQRIRLSTELKNPYGSAFCDVALPERLLSALEHDYKKVVTENGVAVKSTSIRKENNAMKQTTNTTRKTPQKSNAAKYKKPIIISAIVLSIAIAAVVILPKLIKNGDSSSRVTTYNIEKITYGNVTQTISGSGNLSPVKSETIKSSKGGEVESVNYKAGDAVADGDVIAVINGEDITAPFDGILIEQPLKVGDEVAVGGSAAMIMSKDGFTMGIAVDETEISSVALDQEVSFTVDAIDGEYTGKVTAISYNGSSNGGTTAFQITAAVEYAEGIYPGMSASAKIVIEDSGEGLLVPVDAVGTSGDDSYVYIAPSDTKEGDVYEDDQLDVSKLTKITVETGMSDGSYMIVKSDELSEGDLIVITKVTSTQTGSDKSNEQGGFGGGNGFPGGMDFGDFDFGDFDPSQMPQGGSFPGRSN